MSQHYKILIIENDIDLQDLLAIELMRREDFLVSTATTGESGLELIDVIIPDLIILGLDFPNLSGLDLICAIRKLDVRFPIIVLSASTEENIIIRSFELGANDFVGIPLSFSILIARIRAHIHNSGVHANTVFRIGQFVINPTKRFLLGPNGSKKLLTDKEVQVLKFLHQANEKTVSLEALYTGVWGEATEMNSHAVETHIYRIRQKIEPNPRDCVHLISVKGGYQLIH